MQAVKSIPRIKKLPFIKRHKIGIDVAPIERRSAENDRHIDAAFVHQFQIVAHDERRFYKQAAHPDRIRFCLFPRTQNVVDRLFDAEIYDLVAVVGQDNIDQIFADVMDVAL